MAANALYLLAIGGLFSVTVAQSIFIRATRRIFPGIGDMELLMVAQAIYYMLCLFLPVMLMLRVDGAFDSARLRPMPVGRLLGVCAVALLGTLVATQLVGLWSLLLEALGIPISAADIALPSDAGGIAATLFSIGVLPGICEELLFRGAVLGAYERKGTVKAIAISAVLFALLHGTTGGLPAQLLLGAVMGYLALVCDSIYAAMAYHMVHNIAVLLLGALAVRASGALGIVPDAGASMFEQLGGVAGIAATAVQLVICGGLLFLSLWGFGRRARARGIAAVPSAKHTSSAGARWTLAAALLLVAGWYALQLAAAALVSP